MQNGFLPLWIRTFTAEERVGSGAREDLEDDRRSHRRCGRLRCTGLVTRKLKAGGTGGDSHVQGKEVRSGRVDSKCAGLRREGGSWCVKSLREAGGVGDWGVGGAGLGWGDGLGPRSPRSRRAGGTHPG